MRGMVLFLSIVVVIALFSFAAASISNLNKGNKQNNENPKILEFSTFTSAVCENSEDFVHCKDEVFVNCNGKISKAEDLAECDGIKLEVPKATGFAVFGKEWVDPRNN